MAPSRRQAYTFFSALWLTALTCIAAYALNRIQTHSLPIPTALGAFTLALPAIAGLALEALTNAARHTHAIVEWLPKLSSEHWLAKYAIIALFVYETVLATLAGTYIAPTSGLRCGLDEQWRTMYRRKNADVIGRIQDAFECCGLHSTVDMAYPFPSKDSQADACVKMYNRQHSCFDSWQHEERVIAGLLLIVTAAVALWKILVIYLQTRPAPWFDEAREGGEGNGGTERRALEYTSADAPYRDHADAEDGEEPDSPPASRAVEPAPRESH